MPLSHEQKVILKNPGTRANFGQENLKIPDSKAYHRYDKY